MLGPAPVDGRALALHCWHRPVRDDEVGLFLASGDKPRIAIACGHDPITLKLKDTFPRFHDGDIVIDKKDGPLCFLLPTGAGECRNHSRHLSSLRASTSSLNVFHCIARANYRCVCM